MVAKKLNLVLISSTNASYIITRRKKLRVQLHIKLDSLCIIKPQEN